VTEAKKKDLALNKIKEARAKLTEKNWEDIAQKYKLEYKSSTTIRRNSTGVIGENARWTSCLQLP